MPGRRLLRWAVVALAAVAAWIPSAAMAHSLDSSTLSLHVGETGLEATVSLPLQTLGTALGVEAVDRQVALDYLADHLTITGADGATWSATYGTASIKTIEGIESLVVPASFDAAGAEPGDFVVTYDALIEAVANHEAVVVLTDAAGTISTAGVLDADHASLIIGETASVGTGVLDLVSYGLTHVLEGADHLLFLLVLLLPAPLTLIGSRWSARRSGGEWRPALRAVVSTVTAFTVGHSITLIAAGLGVVSAPTRLVESLIAISVGVGAVHALRPLLHSGPQVRSGAVIIAAGFGMVHGLAFAALLGDLGLSGWRLVVSLLAFNVGVELAGLAVVLLLFGPLFAMSATRWYAAVRWTIGGGALALAVGWLVERLDLAVNPLARVEQAALAHPWWVVAAMFALAGCARLADDAGRRTPRVSG